MRVRQLLVLLVGILISHGGWAASVQDIWDSIMTVEMGGKELAAVEKPYLGTWTVYKESTDQGRTYETSDIANIQVKEHSIAAGNLGSFTFEGARLYWDDKNAVWMECCLANTGSLWILQVRGDMPGRMVCIVVEDTISGAEWTHMLMLLKQ